MTGTPTHVHAPGAAFRGKRDYVHSTDIYEEICCAAVAAGLAVEGPFDLRLRSRMTKVPRFELYPGTCGDVPTTTSCTFTSHGTPWVCAVVETAESISARKPYDESPVTAVGVMGERAIEIRAETGLRPIETVTASAVLLLNRLHPPQAGQRWMLGRLSLDRALSAEDSRCLTISLERLIGSSMTRCVIEGSSGPFGSMIFVKS